VPAAILVLEELPRMPVRTRRDEESRILLEGDVIAIARDERDGQGIIGQVGGIDGLDAHHGRLQDEGWGAVESQCLAIGILGGDDDAEVAIVIGNGECCRGVEGESHAGR
jgi:hypothetical protein